jgi:hypothetical protein
MSDRLSPVVDQHRAPAAGRTSKRPTVFAREHGATVSTKVRGVPSFHGGSSEVTAHVIAKGVLR